MEPPDAIAVCLNRKKRNNRRDNTLQFCCQRFEGGFHGNKMCEERMHCSHAPHDKCRRVETVKFVFVSSDETSTGITCTEK